MNQAMLLLAKRGSANQSAPVGESSRVIKSPSRGRENIEVDLEKTLDKNEENADLVPRVGKRSRVDGEIESSRHISLKKNLDPSCYGPGKSLTITSRGQKTLPPMLQSCPSASPLRIEVQPSERWTFGANVPVQVFKAFNLPQDVTSYVDKSRDEVADRCLARGGRFLANLAHIITDYRADVDRQWREGSVRELSEAKSGKLVAEQRAADSERCEAECAAELGALKADNEKMKEAMKLSTDELDKLRASAIEDGRKMDTMGVELGEVKGANDTLMKTVDDLKLDLKTSVEDVAKGIGTGYQVCYDRLKDAGVDLSGHDFDAYCSDLAKNLPEEENGSKD